jgi:hypothetical protein
MLLIEPLELVVKEEMARLFSYRCKWAIPFFAKVFTAGLHSNERASFIEGFVRMNHKYEHSLLDQLDLVRKI